MLGKGKPPKVWYKCPDCKEDPGWISPPGLIPRKCRTCKGMGEVHWRYGTVDGYGYAK